MIQNKSYTEAMLNAEHLVFTNPNSSPALRTIIECYLIFGFIEEAEALLLHLNVDVNMFAEKISRMKKIEEDICKQFNDKKFESCLYSIHFATEETPKSFTLRLLKAKCLMFIFVQNSIEKADEIIKDLLTDFPNNPEVIFSQGEISFYTGKFKQGLRFIERSIDMNGGIQNKKCEKLRRKARSMIVAIDKAEKFIEHEKFSEAIEIFSDILENGDLQKNIFILFLIKRAKVYQIIYQHNDAIFDLTQALGVDSKRADLLLLRAQSYFELDDHFKCSVDCHASIEINPSQEAKNLLQKAKEGRFQGDFVDKLIDEGKMNEVANYYVSCFKRQPIEENFLPALKALTDARDFKKLQVFLNSTKINKKLRRLVPKSLKTITKNMKKPRRDSI